MKLCGMASLSIPDFIVRKGGLNLETDVRRQLVGSAEGRV
ncbi:hypothetical protein STFR1_10497 [Bacillus vallismortis]